MNLKIIKNHHF